MGEENQQQSVAAKIIGGVAALVAAWAVQKLIDTSWRRVTGHPAPKPEDEGETRFSEILAATGRSPSERYADLVARHGEPAYARVDAPATREQKAALKALTPEAVTADEVAGERITAALTEAPGNAAPIGGLKVVTESAWFAARPSGTEAGAPDAGPGRRQGGRRRGARRLSEGRERRPTFGQPPSP